MTDRPHSGENQGWTISDLTLAEQDLISSIRRLESKYGNLVQVVVFLGDAQRCSTVRDLIALTDSVSQMPFEGTVYPMVIKVPADEDMRDEQWMAVHDQVDVFFGHSEEDFADMDDDDEDDCDCEDCQARRQAWREDEDESDD